MPLLTFWSYVKKYWAYVALVVGAIVSAVLLKQQQTSVADQLKQVNDAHAAELKQINDAREAEEKQHLLDEQQLQTTLVSVEKQYDDQKKQLDDQKRAEVIAIVKQYGDDPVALAKKLSDATGFEIILPTS